MINGGLSFAKEFFSFSSDKKQQAVVSYAKACAACHKLQQISGFLSPKFSRYCIEYALSDPAAHSIISDKQLFLKTLPKLVFALFTQRAWRQVMPQQMAKKASFFSQTAN